MHGQQRGPKPRHRARRAGHRGRDVVQLQVEKDVRAARAAYRRHDLRPVPQVQFQADFQHADVRRDERGPPGGGLQVRCVERNGNGCLAGHQVLLALTFGLRARVRALGCWASPTTSVSLSTPRTVSSSSSSRSIRTHAEGSWKSVVPTLTMEAPARISSSASWPVRTPPMPMIGTPGSASLTCQMQRTAIGLMAGPDSPPVSPARCGRIVSVSTTMPSRVLIIESPSAPADTHAFAMATMSVTSGDSFANTGRSYLAWPRTASMTDAESSGLAANMRPRCSTFGHEMLTSIAVTPAASDTRAASSAYSATVLPAIETTARAPRDSSQGRSRCRKASMPGPCRPIELSMPLGVSAIRGVGRPARGPSMTDLVTKAPILETSMNWASSRPAPAHPEAVMIGLGNSTWLSLDRRSTAMALPSAGSAAPTRGPGRRCPRGPGLRLPVIRRAVSLCAISRPARTGTSEATGGTITATSHAASRLVDGYLPGNPAGLRRPARPRLPARRAEGVKRDGADVIPANLLAAEHRPVHAGPGHPGNPVCPVDRQHAGHAHTGPARHGPLERHLHRNVVAAGQHSDLAEHWHRAARVDDIGPPVVDRLIQHVGHEPTAAQRAVLGRDRRGPPGSARGQRAEYSVAARGAEQEVDLTPPLAQPRGE